MVFEQYTAVAGSTLGYSANGNLSSHAGWNYTYDAQNRLESAHQGATQISFACDGLDRCVKRTINGIPTYLCYAGWNLVEERSGNGNVLATYIHGANTDEILTKADANGTLYYHQDALGNVTHLTDSSGNMIEQYRYDAFGHPTIFDAQGSLLVTSAFGNRFLFTGREWLEEAHLYDYRNRVYSADLGRFLQTDPIRFGAGDVNLYRYVSNNPVNWRDPWGLDQMNLFPITDPAHNPTDQRPLARDAYEVAGHGNRDQMFDSNGNPISPEKLADLIKNDPNYDPNKPVRLRSCSTGDDRSPSGSNFAKRLAEALGNDVQAPTRDLNPGPNYRGPDIIRDGGTMATYPH